MKSAVIVFPGSNCDRDIAVALEAHTGVRPVMVWHKDTALPDGTDLVALPGGFSFGDYLRTGAIAARSPVMRAVADFARGGGLVLGICNGFQILIEAGLLPGALMRNATLRFICADVRLSVETLDSPFTRAYGNRQLVNIPVSHHDGAYIADDETLRRLEAEDRIAFRYVDEEGHSDPAANPNGSVANIAGILSENRRILGMMPHPERLADPALGGTDGSGLFRSLAQALEPA